MPSGANIEKNSDTQISPNSSSNLRSPVHQWTFSAAADSPEVPEYCTEENTAQYHRALSYHINHTPISSREQLYEILAQIISEGFHALALKLLDQYADQSGGMESDDINALLFEGMVCYVAKDYDRAEIYYKKAHHLIPAEPAPYANLVTIMCDHQRWQAAREWLTAGLHAHPNYSGLWERAYLLLAGEMADDQSKEENPVTLAKSISSLANEHGSWMGECLACELALTGRADEEIFKGKATILEAYYSRGERGEDFLTEYTGQLGACGQYQKLLNVLWQTRPTASAPWKLIMHGYQAYTALGLHQKAERKKSNLLKRPDLPQEVRNYLLQDDSAPSPESAPISRKSETTPSLP